jgi:CheY-like chemotaxis protein
MDVEMPEMDGIAAAQEIRSMELTGELAEGPVIIACSSHRESEEHERCEHAGMNGFIEKPISRARLQEVIRRLPAA